MAQNEASMKQASSATAAARKFMDESGKDSASNKDEVEKLQTEVNTLKERNCLLGFPSLSRSIPCSYYNESYQSNSFFLNRT